MRGKKARGDEFSGKNLQRMKEGQLKKSWKEQDKRQKMKGFSMEKANVCN